MLGIGAAAKATAKTVSDIKTKELDNRIQRVKYRRDVDLKQIQAEVDLTKVRQKEFTKRHGTINETVQTFRETGSEINHSYDKPYINVDWTTKRGKHIKIELSMLAMNDFRQTFIKPIVVYLNYSALGHPNPWQQMLHETKFNYDDMNAHYQKIVTDHTEAFHKTVDAGTYYNPPMDPDTTTDQGSGVSRSPLELIREEILEKDTDIEKLQREAEGGEHFVARVRAANELFMAMNERDRLLKERTQIKAIEQMVEQEPVITKGSESEGTRGG